MKLKMTHRALRIPTERCTHPSGTKQTAIDIENFSTIYEHPATRDMCKNHEFLVKNITDVRNCIRDQFYRLVIDFRDLNRKTEYDISSASTIFNVLANELGP